jgi:ATP synthase protein I
MSGRGLSAGVRTLLGAAVVALGCGLVLTGVGAVAGGGSAAAGAAVGTAVCVGVFGFGLFTVNAVARVLPSAAVLVALVTYTLQVLLLAVAFVVLRRAGALDGALDRRWLAGAVIAATLGWLAAHVWLALRARIPLYDLSAAQPPATRLTAPDGGER